MSAETVKTRSAREQFVIVWVMSFFFLGMVGIMSAIPTATRTNTVFIFASVSLTLIGAILLWMVCDAEQYG